MENFIELYTKECTLEIDKAENEFRMGYDQAIIQMTEAVLSNEDFTIVTEAGISNLIERAKKTIAKWRTGISNFTSKLVGTIKEKFSAIFDKHLKPLKGRFDKNAGKVEVTRFEGFLRIYKNAVKKLKALRDKVLKMAKSAANKVKSAMEAAENEYWECGQDLADITEEFKEEFEKYHEQSVSYNMNDALDYAERDLKTAEEEFNNIRSEADAVFSNIESDLGKCSPDALTICMAIGGEAAKMATKVAHKRADITAKIQKAVKAAADMMSKATGAAGKSVEKAVRKFGVKESTEDGAFDLDALFDVSLD